MKKNNLLSLIAVILTASIIASCSSDKGLTIEKRHYRKGYSVAWHGSKNHVAQKVNTTNETAAAGVNINEMKPVKATVQNELKTAEPVLTASNEQRPAKINAVETETNNAVANSNETVKNEVVKDNKNETATAAKKYTKDDRRQMRKFLTHRASGDTDLPLWAYILFAILLPPLAVGLFEGIHGPFWICILLTLLFYLPGLIYAIVRVTK